MKRGCRQMVTEAERLVPCLNPCGPGEPVYGDTRVKMIGPFCPE